MAESVKIGVIGGGAWGTALAHMLCQAERDVVLWARNGEVVHDIAAAHRNALYLPDIALDPRLTVTANLAAVADRDVLLLVVPAQQTRATAKSLAGLVRPGTPVIICSKGLEQATGALLSDVVAQELPQAIPAVLSGPSFAGDVARGLPAAVTLAMADEARGAQYAALLGNRRFRVYWSSDRTGVQIGGAVKNVLAIAAGIVDGAALGASAHAALVTRGLAELMRFGRAHGARPETLAGLSGLGDLVLTCGSAQSRNMSLGRALGQGQTLPAILGGRRSVSEGVTTAAAVSRIAAAQGIDMPICDAVAAIVHGNLAIADAIEGLMARPFKAEA